MINDNHSFYIDHCKWFSTHLTYSILCMITLVNTSSSRGNGESILFQPVLKAYPTHHSWLIRAHISLGHLVWHWKSFTRHIDRTHQIIQSLSQWPSAPTQLLSAQQAELTNINDIYTSYKPIIIPAINLLVTDLQLMEIPAITDKSEEACYPLRWHLMLAHRNCHYQRCKQY